MAPWQERTQLLIGNEGLEALAASRVLVAGLGGVGGAAAEMLARAGVGSLTLADSDSISESNINRQLPALHSTVGRLKTEVAAERLRDISPEIHIDIVGGFISEENIESLLSAEYDFVVDAIDTLSPKIALIQWCLRHNLPLVSSMGAGAKMDATKVRIADISETRMCPLAHMLRKRLHRYGIFDGFQAVYSEEKPLEGAVVEEQGRNKRSNTGTISYLPTVFGCVCAQTAICGILRKAEIEPL